MFQDIFVCRSEFHVLGILSCELGFASPILDSVFFFRDQIEPQIEEIAGNDGESGGPEP